MLPLRVLVVDDHRLFRQGLIFSVGLTLLPIGLAALDWTIRLLKVFF